MNLEPNIPLLRANALNLLGNLHSDQGRVDQARECFEASLAIFRELGDRRGESSALNNLGNLHCDQGRMDETLECYEAALAIYRELGDRQGEGVLLGNLGQLHSDLGWMEKARECFEGSLMIARELGNLLSEGWTRADYADHLLKTSEWVSARKMLEQSQQISEELSMKDCLACLHPKWARYWLLVHEEQSFGEGFQPAKQEGWQDASPTGEDTPAKPQAALDKALHHLDVAKGYLADIGGTWETEFGQEITKARRTILEFAAKYGLSEQVTDLAAEQTAEDELREQDEAAG